MYLDLRSSGTGNGVIIVQVGSGMYGKADNSLLNVHYPWFNASNVVWQLNMLQALNTISKELSACLIVRLLMHVAADQQRSLHRCGHDCGILPGLPPHRLFRHRRDLPAERTGALLTLLLKT